MGCPDTIELKCAFCGKDTQSQTKVLGSNSLSTLGIEDLIDTDEYDGIFELKSKCEHCNNPLRIILANGKIMRSTKDDPKYIEKSFGEVENK